MAGLPEIVVTGTLVADPEIRYTGTGVAVCNFTVAANDRRRNQTGEWEDGDATFLRCSVWRQYAEHVSESLSKGQRVLVTGELRQRSYEHDGQKRTAFELSVNEVGPSLRWATAKVTKATRSPAGSSDEPWTTGTRGATVDEPPF
ncbi:single-stranded DNA-binding protein [Actinoalloteichus caeruleus]|uniref:Single-stranded DNA-binding protein n=1 Tax=Actinoalloteichus caeruleus DSM 43889 TaxID=1120930 RepID=A0ABT1JE11_ACTCY|nr:single-stranded DNA-binding protein [Actinoalloteichus caeruleus]MCP2330737.1 single-strand DNA-binding protein [Actinoalloteichus caeruleus DSM 43889]